jgi:hypothetical protein
MSSNTADGSCGAYIGAIAGRQADWRRNAANGENYRDFTNMNPF